MKVQNLNDNPPRSKTKSQLFLENELLWGKQADAASQLTDSINLLGISANGSRSNMEPLEDPGNIPEKSHATRDAFSTGNMSADLYRVFDFISDYILIINSEKKITWCNRSALHLLKFDPQGMALDSILQKFDAKIVGPYSTDDFLNYELNRKIENFQVELTNTGRKIDAIFSFAPITFDNGEIGTVITFRDVTSSVCLETAFIADGLRYRAMEEIIPDDVLFCDKKGNLKYAGPSFLTMLGITMEEARDFGFIKKMHPEDAGPIINRWLSHVQTGEEWEAEPRYYTADNKIVTMLTRARPVRDKNGEIVCWVGLHIDISERRRMEEELKQIEWLLTKNFENSCNPAGYDLYKENIADNTEGEILRSTGESLLLEIMCDYLYILESSGIVMECDGSPALTVFRSEWCRFLHGASRSLCGTLSTEEAMESGQWLCHQDCFVNSAKVALETGKPVDIECSGGIRIYAVPVNVGNERVGAISFSYGDPPRDHDKLREIAARYHTGSDKLFQIVNSCQSRPRFIVETAKNRLHSSARKIGTMVERKRAEIALQRAYSEIEKRVESRTADLSRSYELLKEEIGIRMKAEQEFSARNDALESIYAMATAFSVSLDATIDQCVLSISTMLNMPVVALARTSKEDFSIISQVVNKKLKHLRSVPIDRHPCGIAYREQRSCQISNSFSRLYPVYAKNYPDMKSYVGVPILNSKGQILGTICAIDNKERVLDEYEVHLIEIYARYMGTEIDRKNMENQLLQSQEMKMLGQLTSGVAHEVRNPLNGILAITDALSKDLGENAEYRAYIEHIHKQVIRLSDLMRDLLDLGRPVEKANLMPTSVSWLVSAATNMWQHSSRHHQHLARIQSTEASEKMTIYAERAKMEQVIINLLENASAHSSPEKEILVNIKDAEGCVLIQIIDQGTGIKPENLEHLFDPFFTTRKGGTGLGLGIVKRIVESHGGVVEIRNNLSFPGVMAEIRLPVIEQCARN